MKNNCLRVVAIMFGTALMPVMAMAETYTSVCSGDIEDGLTWGVDPEGFQLNDEDVLIVNHELCLYTKYLAPDVEVGNLTINPEGKVLIKFSGDDYSTARGLNVHGNLVNYGCLGFDRLGNFSNMHDDAVAGGYGRLWLHLWGNLENHGIINTNCLFLEGEGQTISSTEKMQISEFCPKYAKGNVTALSDITLYNTAFSRWAGAVEESQFDALDMNGHTLTLTADAPTEPGIWWYSPGWNGFMADMKILFGNGGKLVVNDCYVSNNDFYGDNMQVASDSHGFFFNHNIFNGNVDLAYGNLHICCTNWINSFEVKGNLVNHTSVNSAEIVYPGKGVDGTDYHMLNVGDYGRTQAGDILVNGNFENQGSFGLGYIYDIDHDAHTTLHMSTLGGDITIKGEITAKLELAQVHPSDDYNSTYNTYDGIPLDKKGSITVNDYLKVNRYQTELETTLIIPADATFYNNADPQSAPINVKNAYIDNERGLWNGLIKNYGTMTCLYSERREWGDMIKAQHIDFTEWARWSFDGTDGYWQVRDHVDYLEITENGNPMGEEFASRSWEVKVHGHDYAHCVHDLTLYYEDEDLNGLNEDELQIYQSLDQGQTWRKVSNQYTVRDSEKNMVQAVNWTTPGEYWIEDFGIFALGSNNVAAIHNLQSDELNPLDSRAFDMMGREVNDDYKGLQIVKGKKTYIR